MDNTSLFLWPREMFTPPSLFKHYVYLGEMAGIAEKYSNVSILDLSIQNISRQSFVSAIKNTDFIFIPVEVYTVRQIVNLLDYARNYTNAKIVAYSTVAALNPKLLESYFDYVISSGFRGNAIKSLITNDMNDFSVDGKIIKSDNHPKNIEWGYAPFNKMPTNDYIGISGGEAELSVQLGCKYNCSFCMEKIFHPASFIEYRPINNIINFFNANKYDKYFLDATTFTANKQWVLDLCSSMKKDLKQPVRWRTVTRIDCLDDEICAALSAAGCYQIGLGIESLSANIQKSVHKIIQESDVIDAFNLLRKHHIEPRGFFILGLPGQTKNDVEYCQDFIKENDIPCRWKEYIPLRNVAKFTNIEEFKPFEKDSFFFHPVTGMSKDEYLNVLLKDTRYKEK